MFIAVTFMCLVNGECRFLHDHMQTTEAECEIRNEVVATVLDADDNVTAYRTICIPVPKEEFNARS